MKPTNFAAADAAVVMSQEQFSVSLTLKITPSNCNLGVVPLCFALVGCMAVPPPLLAQHKPVSLSKANSAICFPILYYSFASQCSELILKIGILQKNS